MADEHREPKLPDSPESQKPKGPGDPDEPQGTPGPPDNPLGPGKPADTPMADAQLSQPPSPPSLAQASAETRHDVMERLKERGEMGELFTLWQKEYQVVHQVPAGVLCTEVNPANDPRVVYLISHTLYDEAKRLAAEHQA